MIRLFRPRDSFGRPGSLARCFCLPHRCARKMREHFTNRNAPRAMVQMAPGTFPWEKHWV